MLGLSWLSTKIVISVSGSLVNPIMSILVVSDMGIFSICMFWGPWLSVTICKVAELVLPAASVAVIVTFNVPLPSGRVIAAIKSPVPLTEVFVL